MKKFKKIIPIIITFIIGISTTVTAATIFNSKDITYSSDQTDKTNVKDSLDELYEKLGKCPEGYGCFELKGLAAKVELGDYISMTPTKTSYTISKDLTGYNSDQTINPSELNLWRVIKKNDDGTVDIVSEYVSNEVISFYGKTGYLNYIGVLNSIAEQYSNYRFVARTRHFGYEGSPLFCKNESEVDCRTSHYEFRDKKYLSRINKLITTTKDGLESSRYFMARRTNWEEILNAQCLIPELEDISGCGGFYFLNGEESRVISARLRPIQSVGSWATIASGDGKSIETAYELE